MLWLVAGHTAHATITISNTPSNKATSFTMRLRIPSWTDATAKVTAATPGEQSEYSATPGAYSDITRYDTGKLMLCIYCL